MSEPSQSQQHRVFTSDERLPPSMSEILGRAVLTAGAALLATIFVYTCTLSLLALRAPKNSTAAIRQESIGTVLGAVLHGTTAAAFQNFVSGIPQPPASLVMQVRLRSRVVPPQAIHGFVFLLAMGLVGYSAGQRRRDRFVVIVPMILLPCTMGFLSTVLLPPLQQAELWLGCILVIQVAAIYMGAVIGKLRRRRAP